MGANTFPLPNHITSEVTKPPTAAKNRTGLPALRYPAPGAINPTPRFAARPWVARLAITVPVAAIVTTGSGTSYVTVTGTGGKQTQVPVTPGISENGYVQVTPVRGAKLAVGDSVVVSG